jgi:hypothetical protein
VKRRIDLFKLAEKNVAPLATRFGNLLEEWRKDGMEPLLQGFHDTCEESWTISINLTNSRLDFFLKSNETYNRYRFDHAAKKQVFKTSHLPGESPVDWSCYETELGEEWGPRRRAFNEYASGEEEFTYGAYYVKGRGIFADAYGRYLLLMKREWPRLSSRLTFLMADSLQRYTKPPVRKGSKAKLLKTQLRAEIATGSTVTKLMCCKKANDLKAHGIDTCTEMLCSPNEYIEAQIAEPIHYPHVEKVLMPLLSIEESDLQFQMLGAFDAINPQNLSKADQKNAYYYTLFSSEFPSKGISVEYFEKV